MPQSQMKQTRSAAFSTALLMACWLQKLPCSDMKTVVLTLKQLFSGSNCTLQVEVHLPSGTQIKFGLGGLGSARWDYAAGSLTPWMACPFP